jgi:hypothetical protein
LVAHVPFTVIKKRVLFLRQPLTDSEHASSPELEKPTVPYDVFVDTWILLLFVFAGTSGLASRRFA